MHTTLKELITERLDALGIGPIEAATVGGLERNYVSDILAGRKKSVRFDGLFPLALALKTPIAQVLASSAQLRSRLKNAASRAGFTEEGLAEEIGVDAWILKQFLNGSILTEAPDESLRSKGELTPTDIEADLIEKVFSVVSLRPFLAEDWLKFDTARRQQELLQRPKDAIIELNTNSPLIPEIVEIVTTQSMSRHAHILSEFVRRRWNLPLEFLIERSKSDLPNLIAFAQQGDSMAPTINDGDIVFLDVGKRVPSPPGLFALVDRQGGIDLRRLEIVSDLADDDTQISIRTDNPKYREKVSNIRDLAILGRYIFRITTSTG